MEKHYLDKVGLIQLLESLALKIKSKFDKTPTLENGKIPVNQIPDLPYIPTSAKGTANGVAELNNNRKVYNDQLEFAYRGWFTKNISNTDIESGIYTISGRTDLGDKVLNKDSANGIFIQYPGDYRNQTLIVGRPANDTKGELVEIYTRRYLPSANRWTRWNNGGSEYSLKKEGSNILLWKNDTMLISTVIDDNTVYSPMLLTEADAGTATIGRVISAKVLKTTIQKMLDNFSNLSLIPVDVLPTASSDTKNGIYLVPRNNYEQDNIKDEYITIETEQNTFVWEKIGSTDIDLSNYSTTEEMMEAIASELQDYLTSAYEIVDELPTPSSDTQDKFYIVEEEEEEKLDKIDFDLEFSDEVTDYTLGDYVPRSDTQKWGTDARNKHVYFPVTAGEKYIVKDLGSRSLCTYCFLTEYNGSEREGNIPLVEGTEVYEVTKPNGYEITTIPEGCTIFVFSYNIYTDDINELRGKVYKYRNRHLNDYATKDYVRVNGGKIDVIKYNGTPLEIVNKAVDIPVPAPYDDTAIRELISTETARAQDAEQELRTDITEQTGIIQTKIEEMNVAKDATIAATSAAQTATQDTVAATQSANTAAQNANVAADATNAAIAQAERLNVELEGSVITITNKEGVEKEIDLQDATDERVFINCSTTVEGTSVSGLNINVYYDDVLHTTLTTNAQGSARIDIPNGTIYRIVFPRLVGCNPIPDVRHTAVMSQRSVEAVYVEEFIAYEHVKFNVKKADSISDIQPFEGVEVKVEYDEHVEHYISDAQGVIEFDIPIGTTYAYTVIRPDGYYMYEGRNVFTKLASSALYEATIKLVPYETGIFIITNNGGHYTFDQYKTAVESGVEHIEDAKLIKIATELLNSNDSPFCISIDETVDGYSGRGSMIMRTGQVLPMSENSAFNGYINSTYLADNSSGFVPHAVSMCLEKTITLGSLTAHGFLGAIQQLSTLINLRNQIDDIIDYTRPTTTGRLSDLLGVKWSSTRIGNTAVATYSSSMDRSGTSVSGSIIYQYFITFYTI